MKGNYKDLKVWKKSVILVTNIYEIVKLFPKDELYGLSDQIKRCAVSIPSNIAEGANRNSQKEFINFLYIAKGSLAELETQIIIAKNLKFINKETFDKKQKEFEEISKMISGMIKYLKSN